MNRKLFALALVLFTGVLNTHSQGTNELEDDILNFAEPLELQKNFPYFLSGFDKENSPVWVVEYGKWDVRSMVERGGNEVSSFDKYTEKMWARFHQSTKEFPENTEGYLLIIDLEGYNSRQATSLQAVQKTLNVARQATHQVRKKGRSCKGVYLINSNFLFQTVFNLIKPVLGELAAIVELYGTNDEKWKAVLRKEINPDQIPEWLGGSKDHKPIRVHG